MRISPRNEPTDMTSGDTGRIVMLGTSFETQGGVSSVVNVYRRNGLFERWPIHYIATHRDGGAVTKLVALARGLTEYLGLLLTGKVAVVHAHTASRASFWRKSIFFALTFIFGKPLIFHLHGAQFMRFYHDDCGPLGRRFISWVLDRSACIVVLSSQWRGMLEAICRNPNIRVVHNPIELDADASLRGSPRAENQVLFLGRLGKRKGSYDLVDALQGVADRVPDVRLLCGGDGELTEVGRYAEEKGVAGHLELLGWVTGDRKAALLREATVYVLPSYDEGLPMSVLEAMAAGMAVVTTPVGGIPDLVKDGHNGFLVEPGDVDALAARIAELLEDPARRRQLGDNAVRTIDEGFTPAATFPAIDEIYRGLSVAPREGSA